jgi:hypothetical protein
MDQPSQRIIYKNTSIEFLDDFYRNGVDAAVDFGQRVLSSPNDVLAVANDWADESDFDKQELQGFQSQWLGGALAGHDVDGVVRNAYVQALELANAPRLENPSAVAKLIETFWLTGFGDAFEIHVHDGPDRVTMFMVLPLERPYGSNRALTRSYVVTEGDPSVMTRTSGAPGPDDA